MTLEPVNAGCRDTGINDVRYFEVTDAMLTSAHPLSPGAEPSQPFGSDRPGMPIVLKAEQRTLWMKRFNDLPVMRHLGAQVDLDDEVNVRVLVPRFEPYHLGGMGGATMNGGVIAAMFDCALGVAGWVQNPDRTSGTIQLDIQLMRAVSEPRVACYARATRATRTAVFVEAVLFDGRNRACAQASGIVAVA